MTSPVVGLPEEAAAWLPRTDWTEVVQQLRPSLQHDESPRRLSVHNTSITTTSTIFPEVRFNRSLQCSNDFEDFSESNCSADGMTSGAANCSKSEEVRLNITVEVVHRFLEGVSWQKVLRHKQGGEEWQHVRFNRSIPNAIVFTTVQNRQDTKKLLVLRTRDVTPTGFQVNWQNAMEGDASDRRGTNCMAGGGTNCTRQKSGTPAPFARMRWDPVDAPQLPWCRRYLGSS